MLLAEVFWKEPNVYDVAGVLGLVIGIASIWLAKRDIDKRITEGSRQAAEAAREEVRRVARGLLHSGVAGAIRSLELAREVCNGKRWGRAAELCILASEQLAKVAAQPTLTDSAREELRGISTKLVDCLARLRSKRTDGSGEVPKGVLQALDESLLTLHRIEGALTGIQTEQ